MIRFEKVLGRHIGPFLHDPYFHFEENPPTLQVC